MQGERARVSEDRGLLRAGQDHDEVGHPAYLLPTPRQSLSSEHNIWPNSLKYLLCWDYLQQIIYHELKVDK